jgi:hypothetical protein
MKCGILVDIAKHVNKLNVTSKLSILCIFHIKLHRLLHQLDAPKHVGVTPIIFLLRLHLDGLINGVLLS